MRRMGRLCSLQWEGWALCTSAAHSVCVHADLGCSACASPSREALEDLFNEYQVDLVLSGHVHSYR